MRKKDSLVWRYFDEGDKDSAVCQLCYKKYSRKGRGTGSLRSHLKSMHQSEYLELRNDELRIWQLLNKNVEGQTYQRDCSESDNSSSICFVATTGQPASDNFHQQQVKVEYGEEDSPDDDNYNSEPEHFQSGPSQNKKPRMEMQSDTDSSIVTECTPNTSERIKSERTLRQKLVLEKGVNPDAVDVFFSSMALTVKQMPPALAAKCKAEICNVVTKWELLALEQAKITPSQSTE